MNLVIIGAGGLAREVFDLANIIFANDVDFKIKGFLSKEDTGITNMGYPPILGNSEQYNPEGEDVFFCAIGNVQRRKIAVENILKKGGKFINLIHPTAQISPSVKLGMGIAIKSYCVIASDVTIGDFSYFQSSVIMGHDVSIGAYCHVNSFAFFAGNVEVQQLVTVNAGAKILQKVCLETASVIGIGSVVIHKVKQGATVFGVPAKRIN